MTSGARPNRPEFEIQVEDGCGWLLLRPRLFFGWLNVERLQLEIPNVSFPLDITRGLAQFQDRRCRLLEAAMSVDEEACAAFVAERRRALGGAGFDDVRVRFLDGAVSLGARARVGADGAELAARLTPIFAGRELHLVFDEVLIFGRVRRPAWLLAHDLLSVLLGAALNPTDEAGASVPVVEGLGRIVVRPLDLLFTRVLPEAGWRLPDAEGMQLSTARVARGRAEMRFSAKEPAMTAAALPPETSREGDAAMLRSDFAGAAAAYRAKSSTARLLSVLAARDAWLGEAESLARGENSRAAYATLGVIAEGGGRAVEAAEHYAIVMEAARDDETALRAGRAAARLAGAADPVRAAAAFERVLAASPGDEEARRALFAYYMNAAEQTMRDDAAEARSALERALALAGGSLDGRTQLRIARAWQALGEPERAQAQFRALLESAPETLDVGELFAARLEVGDLDGARRLLDERGHQPDAAALALMARLQEGAGQPDEALKSFGAAAARLTGEEAARLEMERARLCVTLGRGDDARTAWRAAFHAAPGSATALSAVRALAADARAIGDPELEARWLDEELKRHQDVGVALRRAQLHAAAGETDAAGRLLDGEGAIAALQVIDPVERRVLLAVVLDRRLAARDDVGARAAIDALRSLAPDDPSLRAAEAELAWRRRAWDDVVQLYGALVDDAPPEHRAEWSLRLGLGLERHGRAREATARYEAALADSSTSGAALDGAWLRMAEMHDRAGEYDRAADAWASAAADARSGIPAVERAERRRRAAELHHRRLGDSQHALGHLEEALRLEPAHLPSLDLLESIHAESGNEAGVAQTQRRKEDATRLSWLARLERDPRSEPALRFLVEDERARGNIVAMQQYLERLVELVEGDERVALVERRVRVLLHDLVDPIAAVTACRAALAGSPSQPRLLALLAETARAADQPRMLAEALLARVPLAESSGERATLVIEAADLFRSRLDEPARAEALYRALGDSELSAAAAAAPLSARTLEAVAERHPDPAFATLLAARAAELTEGDERVAALRLAANRAREAGDPEEARYLGALRASGDAELNELMRLSRLLDAKGDASETADVLADALAQHSAALAKDGRHVDALGRAILADLQAAAATCDRFDALAAGLEQIAAVEPDPATAASELCEAALLWRARLGDPLRGADLLERALRLRPDRGEILVDLEALLRGIDPGRLRAALELHLPTLQGAARAPVLQKLARVCGDLGDDTAAEAYATEAQGHEPPRAQPQLPSTPHPIQVRALVRAVTGSEEGDAARSGYSAEELLEVIRKLQSEIARQNDLDQLRSLRASLAWVYRRAGDVSSARAEFARLVHEEPSNRELVAALADTAVLDAQWSEALGALDHLQLLAEAPAERAALLYRMGEIQRVQLGDAAGAVEKYLKAVDIDPAHLPTLRRLIDHFFTTGDETSLVDLARALDDAGGLTSPELDPATRTRACLGLCMSGEADRAARAAEVMRADAAGVKRAIEELAARGISTTLLAETARLFSDWQK